MHSDQKIAPQNYIWLILLAAIFGSNFMMTKVAVQALPPMFVVSARLAIAACVLGAVMLIAGKRFPPLGKVWWFLLGSAFFGHTLPFSLISWGQETVDAGLAAILMATMPLLTLLLAHIFTRDEKPNRYTILGFALALIGIVVLFGFDKLASLADQSLRQYAIMLAAMSYGVNAVITKFLTDLAWQASSTAFMLLAFLTSLPLLFVTTSVADLQADWNVWAAVLYTGLFPTALAAIMIIFIVRLTSASFLSQINFMVPLFGVLFAIIFLGEKLPANAALALLIILIGVAIARWRPKRVIVSINKGG